MGLKIKTVLVTGASSGIGLDIARGFLEKGFNVVLNARDEERLSIAKKTLGDEKRTANVVGDIGDPETGEKMVRAAVDRFGSVDVLVNNAGIFGAKPFLENTEEDIDRFIHINLKGTYFVSQAAVRQMKQQGGGSIVNIGTVLVSHPIGSIPASAAMITKGGVHALTTSLASELAADNIRVNLVAPGMIRTPLWGDANVDDFGGVALLNRVGEVQEITEAVFSLATAGFTTGVILPVDGGYVHGRA
ncbi:MAG: SDR family oxidoreductase [Nitrospina sp.]|jgi:NAD(P)-dependent dehydrogenase (short-subunit alcohol dehydrogenase family)|nr:SDR family oxidoreductase [Nitrospina sp.]MBT6716525.1 SDR family oxidoreductase [Nitrospina sp.]